MAGRQKTFSGKSGKVRADGSHDPEGLGVTSAISRVLLAPDEARVAELERAVWDLALGYCVLLPFDAKPPTSKRIEEYVVRGEDGEPESIRVYIEPPDPIMLRHLIEQNVGRPGSRGHREQELKLTVMHAIPGWDVEDDEELDRIAQPAREMEGWEEVR